MFTDFIAANPGLISADNAMPFISDDGGKTYNRCHCKPSRVIFCLSRLTTTIVWSNFEIGDLDLWRGEAYSKYFDYLDQKGGFYYEVNIIL
jgi:alpha 1,2-mannosyltransferase